MTGRGKLTGRSLLTLQDLLQEDLMGLLDLADQLKEEKAAGKKGTRLAGKQIALLFEKLSTRTRCSASVAAASEGGHAEFLSATEIHLGKKESVEDTARVLGRMFDGILFRGYKQATVECLSRYAGIPVWNGLTDDAHPMQTLADLQTIREAFGKLEGVKVVYVGDGRNNVANSLMLGCAMGGMHFVNCTPPELSPQEDLVGRASEMAAAAGGSVEVIYDPRQAVEGAGVLYTDVWVSMGEEAKFAERLELLRPYQVNMEIVEATGNASNGKVIFLHCLPAFHDYSTEVTQELGALEVTDDVFESPISRVFDQAENRVHTAKALFVATLT